MPDEWWGYEGVDALVLGTADEATAGELAIESPQLAALDQWVRMGGTLVITAGRNAEKMLATGSPLARLAPGAFDSMVPLRPSTELEAYAETTEPIDDVGNRFAIRVPKLVQVRGRIEASAGSRRATCRWWYARRTGSAR